MQSGWMLRRGSISEQMSPDLFIKINVNAAPLITMTGRDKYINGDGNMLIKFWDYIQSAIRR